MKRDWSKEFAPLLAIALIAAGVWAFVELSDEVVEGDAKRVDQSILMAMRSPDDPKDPRGPEWLEEMVRDITALGSTAVLLVLTVAATGFLLLARKPSTALLLASAITSGALVSTGLKIAFGRERPTLVAYGTYVSRTSFPSGHAMLSALTYLTLAALLMRVEANARIKAYLLFTALLLTLIVGVSRIYLGVHWPTDVLAGWTAGATWAIVWWLIAHHLQRCGKLEREGAEAIPKL